MRGRQKIMMLKVSLGQTKFLTPKFLVGNQVYSILKKLPECKGSKKLTYVKKISETIPIPKNDVSKEN